jgi:hypothetical protein
MSIISIEDARQKHGVAAPTLVSLTMKIVEGSGCSKVYIFQKQGSSVYSHFKLFFPAETVAVANRFAMQDEVVSYKKIFDNGQVDRNILDVRIEGLPVRGSRL